jgi:hypothetical protein
MQRHLKALLQDKAMAAEIAGHGLATLRARHTCAHRVDELLVIWQELQAEKISLPKLTKKKVLVTT